MLLAVTAATLQPPAAPAAAAVPTCRGERATLVGSIQRPTLRGTERRDVIVTAGSRVVEAGGGADLVCVTGPSRVAVDDGPGDDVVDGRRSQGVGLRPSAGDDLLLGSRYRDEVLGGSTGRDVFRLGAGRDRVAMHPDAAAQLGPGDDEAVWLAGEQRGGVVQGGAGRDRIGDSVGHADGLLYDNRRGVARQSGSVLIRWESIEVFTLSPNEAGEVIRFRGGRADETITRTPREGEVALDMGGGDDEVHAFLDHSVRLSGGSGHDVLALRGVEDSYTRYDQRLDIDLAAGTLVATAGDGQTRTIDVRGVDDVRTSLHTYVRLSGDEDPNDLDVVSCGAELDGLGGPDRLQ